MAKSIIVAGNWKMNKTYQEALDYISYFNQLQFQTKAIIGAPSIYCEALQQNNINKSLHFAFQNCNEHESGAYTGEISAMMISSLGLSYCIVGHSERRQYYGETNDMISKKIDQCLHHHISPIVCCGETLEEREKSTTNQVIRAQLESSLKNVSQEQMEHIIIAYEPVWAIGTGRNASSIQAEEVHQFICHWLEQRFSLEIAKNTPILYGGSCNENNAKELFGQPNIWGGLIGGASLSPHSFEKIIQIAEEINHSLT